MKGLVSIIIVNWNGLHWLKISLPSLARQIYKPVEIILVDNASSDDSVSWTKKHFPDVKIVRNTKNEGFAEGNNAGYRVAKGDYILLLNNDIQVKQDFIVELVWKMKSDPMIGAAQCKLLLMDDHSRLDAVGAYLTPTGFLFHWGFGKRDAKKYDATENLYTAKGAAVMFTKEILRHTRVGNSIFDPTYFAYFEETDLCHRIWLSGKRVVYAPKSVVYHKMGGTSIGMDNAFIQYHSFKNRICTYLKNLSVGELVKMLPVHICMCEFFALTSFVKGKFALSWAIQRSICWNVLHGDEIWRKRQYVQRYMRTTEDRTFLPLIGKNPSVKYYFTLSQGKPSDEA